MAYIENTSKRVVCPIYLDQHGKPQSLQIVPGKMTDPKVEKQNQVPDSVLKSIGERAENKIFFVGPGACLVVHKAKNPFTAGA